MRQLATVFENPFVLLAFAGGVLGIGFPMSKLAGLAHISPLVWALLISVSAIVTLLPILYVSKQAIKFTPKIVKYALFSGTISFFIPSVVSVTVAPKLGAGYTGLMFAFSPIFTLLLMTAFRMRKFEMWTFVGTIIALVGVFIITLTSMKGSQNVENSGWVLLAFLIPISLASGNIYRTKAWPEGATSTFLAFSAHIAATLLYITVLLVREELLEIYRLATISNLAFGQMWVSGLLAFLIFRLQQQGGPFMMSQTGYVGAAVSLFVSSLFMGETYITATWVGVAILFVGVVITLSRHNKVAV